MTLCIIPARWNSSRFPGKLLTSVQGKTILQRTYESVLECPSVEAIYIATDDVRIEEHSLSFGANVIGTSSTCENGTERILEALSNEPSLKKFPYLLNVQGDHPCISKEIVESVLGSLLANPSAVAATAACPIYSREEFESPHVVKCVLTQEGSALYFSRSPIPYCQSSLKNSFYGLQHIGIYAFRTPFFLSLDNLPSTSLQQLEDLEQLKWLELGLKVQVAQVSEAAIAIDTPQDLLKLEEFLCRSNTFS